MNLRIILCFSGAFIFAPILSISQSLFGDFKGTVLSPNGSPLPYVSVGVVNKPIGTISNEQGNFLLDLNRASAGDTIKLSLVGYTSQEFPLSDLRNAGAKHVFHLVPRAIQLTEVQIVGKKDITETTIGRTAKGGILQATFNPSKTSIREKLGTEIGMKMDYSRHTPATLKTFHWFLSANNFNYLKLRVNVYSVKNGLPDSLITNQNIIVEVPQEKTGWMTVDLLPYHIQVQDDFAISMQWLDSKITDAQAPKIWIPGTVSPFGHVYYRDASQDKWRRAAAKISYYVTILY